MLHTGTPIAEADAGNYVFAVGDYDEDGIPDLYCLKHSDTASGKLELNVLRGAGE